MPTDFRNLWSMLIIEILLLLYAYLVYEFTNKFEKIGFSVFVLSLIYWFFMLPLISLEKRFETLGCK